MTSCALASSHQYDIPCLETLVTDGAMLGAEGKCVSVELMFSSLYDDVIVTEDQSLRHV